MSNITNLEFVSLDNSSKNYFCWILNVEIHLDLMNLGISIREGNDAS